MGLNQEFLQIYNSVLKTKVNHQKYEQTLLKLFKKMDFEDFFKEFMEGLDISFRYQMNHSNKSVENFISFMAMFVATVVRSHEHELQQSNILDEEGASHPLLSRTIKEVLKFSNLDYTEARYNSCFFIQALLNFVGDDVQLDEDICDEIQNRMLLRMEDCQAQIRRQAILALVRLQDPAQPDCPVIEAFMEKLTDVNALVRKEATTYIATNAATLGKIIERMRDIDPNVRAAAFLKCSNFGPKYIKIVQRQEVLTNGFVEENPAAKKIFLEVVLPKWLSVYDGNILKFLKAIKLDADESDMQKTIALTERILKVFFETMPMKEIIDLLGLSEDKLADLEHLTIEQVTYWHCLFQYLQGNEELEEYIEEILPDLKQFCDYIQRFIDVQEKKTMKEWVKMEYQQIVLALFRIAGKCDLSDEVGRKSLLNLIRTTLSQYRMDHSVNVEMMKVLYKMFGNTLDVCIEGCNAIAHIREHTVRKPTEVSATFKANQHFQLITLQAQQVRLEYDQEQAIKAHDFELAANIEKQLAEIKDSLNIHNEPPPVEEVRELNNSPEVICHSLNILIAMLSQPKLQTVHPPLSIMKKELVDPYLRPSDRELYSHVLRCIVLYALIDEETAKAQVAFIVAPIMAYKLSSDHIKSSLTASINGVVDLLKMYGPGMFQQEDASDHQDNSKRKNGRRLYPSEGGSEITDVGGCSLERIIDSFLDMLDDEDDGIRDIAGSALTNLVSNKLVISPSLITRLLIKWLSPLTVKHDPKFVRRLNVAFSHLAVGMEEVFEHAVLPTLDIVANAPKKSPISDINSDKLVQVLSEITKLSKENTTCHKNLAYAICTKIGNDPEGNSLFLYTKMLCCLAVPFDDTTAMKELQANVENLLEIVKDKIALKNLQKYKLRLLKIFENYSQTNLEITNFTVNKSAASVGNQTESTIADSVGQAGDGDKSNSNNKTPDKGRRKSKDKENSAEKSKAKNRRKSSENLNESKRRMSDGSQSNPKKRNTEKLSSERVKLRRIENAESNKEGTNSRKGRPQKSKTGNTDLNQSDHSSNISIEGGGDENSNSRRSHRLLENLHTKQLQNTILALDKKVVPILGKIENAPAKTPSQILTSLLKLDKENQLSHELKNLPHAICLKLSKTPNHKQKLLFSKLLLGLELPKEHHKIAEMLDGLNGVLKRAKEQQFRNNLISYTDKLSKRNTPIKESTRTPTLKPISKKTVVEKGTRKSVRLSKDIITHNTRSGTLQKHITTTSKVKASGDDSSASSKQKKRGRQSLKEKLDRLETPPEKKLKRGPKNQ